MTRNEGLMWLRAWREIYIPQAMQKYRTLEPRMHGQLDFGPKCLYKITSGVEYIWLHGLVDELINRVTESEFDPVTEVALYAEDMEHVLATAPDGHFITHRFAGFMCQTAHDILWYLMRKEKMMSGKPPESRADAMRRQIQEELDLQGILASADSFIAKGDGKKYGIS